LFGKDKTVGNAFYIAHPGYKLRIKRLSKTTKETVFGICFGINKPVFVAIRQYVYACGNLFGTDVNIDIGV
jgi:hypothetical protein